MPVTRVFMIVLAMTCLFLQVACKPDEGPFVSTEKTVAPATVNASVGKSVEKSPAAVPAVLVKSNGAAPEGMVPAGMVMIPGGSFFRGCSDGYNGVVDDKCASSERPAGMVAVRGFFIDINEVTVKRYTACVDAGACDAPFTGGECNFGESKRGSYPINCVTWDEACRFCAWEGKRLPTEAEWEKAARGTDGRKYPWGSDAPDAADVYRANYGEGLTKLLWMRDQWEYDAPTGFFSKWASPYRCNDMAGNVAEWVEDWWVDSYEGLSADNPTGPAKGNQHVVRGGSFREYRQRIRTSARGYHYIDFMDGNVGFRCAVDAEAR